MKKIGTYLGYGSACFLFDADAGRKPCSGSKRGGSHTVRQAANLFVMMVLLVHRKKHALTEV